MKKSFSVALYYEMLKKIVRMDIDAYATHLLTRKNLRKLLVPAIIGCEYSGKEAVDTNTIKPKQVNFHPTMNVGLAKLLPYQIGQKTPCGNRVGACAENMSGNSVLWQLNDANQNIPELKDLKFTVALRPRTFSKVPTCDNCLTVFN